GMAGGGRRGMTRATYPGIHPRQDQPRKHLGSSRGAHLRPSKQEESGDHMKLWKCDAVGPIEGVMSISVVVMAGTRQNRIGDGERRAQRQAPGGAGRDVP